MLHQCQDVHFYQNNIGNTLVIWMPHTKLHYDQVSILFPLLKKEGKAIAG